MTLVYLALRITYRCVLYRVGIIGAGNSFMGDDGVGTAVLKLLMDEPIPEDVGLIDIGTSGLNLLHFLAKISDTAVIVDAVDFGGSVAETRCFSLEDIKSIKQSPGLSSHECDLLKMIELSKKLGECPKTVLIFAIQPASMTPSMKLSSPLKMKLPEFVKNILEIIHS